MEESGDLDIWSPRRHGDTEKNQEAWDGKSLKSTPNWDEWDRVGWSPGDEDGWGRDGPGWNGMNPGGAEGLTSPRSEKQKPLTTEDTEEIGWSGNREIEKAKPRLTTDQHWWHW